MSARPVGPWTFLLAAALAVAGAPAAADEKTAAPPSFAGRWRINTDLSDKPASSEDRAAAKAAGEKKEGGGGAASRPEAPKSAGGPASASPPAEASTEFTVRQTEIEIVAQEASGQSRSFYPNGRSYKADEGTSSTKSTLKDGVLVFEKKNARGWKYTETWQLTPEGRLRVDTRLAGGGQRSVATRRVYDRIP
jgi:hypothetical protein